MWMTSDQVRLREAVAIALDEVLAGHESVGYRLTGPSGAGKSFGLDRVAELIAERAPKPTNPRQRANPVIRIDARDAYTPDAFHRALLSQQGRPVTGKPAPGMLAEMVHDSLDANATYGVIIEEYHNLIASTTEKFRQGTQQALKGLWNRAPAGTSLNWSTPGARSTRHPILIIVSGVNTLNDAFDKDPELSSRFPHIIQFRRPHLGCEEDVSDVRRVLHGIAVRSGMADIIDAKSNDLVYRVIVATQAHFRQISALVARAKMLRRKDHLAKAPALELLAEAFRALMPACDEVPNPFELSREELVLRLKRAQVEFGADPRGPK